MTVCSVKWCGKSSLKSNYKKDGITFHRFPKCAEMKQKWMNATGRDCDGWSPTTNSAICSRHFTEDSFYEMKNRRRVMVTAIPTLYLPILSPTPRTEDLPSTSTPMLLISSNSQNNTMPLTCSYTLIDTTKIMQSLPPANDTSSAHDSPVKKRLRRRIAELKNIMRTKNILLRKIRDKNRKLKRTIVSLKESLSELDKNNLISTENKCTTTPED